MVNIKHQLNGMFKTLTIKKGKEPYIEAKFRFPSNNIGASEEFPFAKVLQEHLKEFGFDPMHNDQFGSKSLNALTVSKFEMPCSIVKSFSIADSDGSILDEQNKKVTIRKTTVTIGYDENTIDLVMEIEMNGTIDKLLPSLIDYPIFLQFVPYVDDQISIFEENKEED